MAYFIRAYLRASTDEQDAQRARGVLDAFAAERNLDICNYYVENESGAKLNRPELFRLLHDCRPRDVLLVEDVDRLSRLTATDWDTLKTVIRTSDVRVVAVNVPTTWHQLSNTYTEFDARMFGAINSMLIDMLAAIARRDYEQRRERQAQGIIKAKAVGKYQGRRIDQGRYDAINRMLASGNSWSVVQKTIGCSRSTISSATKHASRMPSSILPIAVPTSAKTIGVIIWLNIKNGSKFTRGKKRAMEEVERLLLSSFQGTKLNPSEYRVVFRYNDGGNLKQQIADLLMNIHETADFRNCGVEYTVKDEATDRYWSEYDGEWK